LPETFTVSATGILTSWKLPESAKVTRKTRFADTSTVFGVDVESCLTVPPATASVFTSAPPVQARHLAAGRRGLEAVVDGPERG
jgi:hypothetical protein